MSIVLGRGQCGAHITLLFTIDDSSEDPVYQGSRGAGICLKDGVEAIAKGEKGSGEMIVRFKNGEYNSRMYQDVLSELVEEIPENESPRRSEMNVLFAACNVPVPLAINAESVDSIVEDSTT